MWLGFFTGCETLMDIRPAWCWSGTFWAVFAATEKAVFKRSACCADHIVTGNTAISTHFSLVKSKIKPPEKNPKPTTTQTCSFLVVFWNLNVNISSSRKLLFLCVGLMDVFSYVLKSFCVSHIWSREETFAYVNIWTVKNTLKCNTCCVWVAFLWNNTELLVFRKFLGKLLFDIFTR